MIEFQEKLLPLYCNGKHIGTILLDRAILSAKDGDAMLVWKGRGRKSRITAVHMLKQRTFHRSPCTLTRGDSEKNAAVSNGAIISPKDSMAALSRAADKVAAWPSVHDSKAPVISAGTVYGVFCPYPPMEERIVTFA